MEKWESYRNEINQSSQIGYTISLENEKIEKYKQEIDKVNPSILSGFQTSSLTLHKGVSEVVVSQNQVPVEITKLFSNLNKAKSVNNRNNISTILFNLKNDNILNDNKRIKEEWLNNNPDYYSFANYIQQANLSFEKDKEFEKDLQLKYESLSKQRNDGQIMTIHPLNRNGQKNIGHHVFIISVAIAMLFFVITLVLLIVRLVS